MSTKVLVDKFNKLPHKRLAPSGKVPNEYHFDIRYVAMEPPSHVMLLFQPESKYIHIERLPAGLPSGSSGIEFFPETAEQAAPTIAQAILHSFTANVDKQAKAFDPSAVPPQAPWKLMTEDPDLARAIGKELRSLGVRVTELHTISISPKKVVRDAQEAFNKLFAMIRSAPVIKTPDAIIFRAPVQPSDPPPADETSTIVKYVQTFNNAKPPREADPAWLQLIPKEVAAKTEYLSRHPAHEIKGEADAGNPTAMVDLAMRHISGYQCKPDRAVWYEYLVKAIKSPNAPAELKSTAHALLIDWFVSGCGKSMPIRYMLAASHHAEHALRLAQEVSPPGHNASGAVLYFLMYLFRDNAEKLVIPELLVHYKTCWDAIQTRLAQVNKESGKMQVKRMKQPNRYRCANPGCGIVADKGKMLMQCSGKCDADKKPAYCGKACQKADWKNHKPFCKPGMPCSVIDDSADDPVDVGGSRDGAYGIRVPMEDGTRTITSSTLTPEQLKDFRDAVAQHRGGVAPPFESGLAVDMSALRL
ncbi:hypothetical protein K525DRAFT_204344 [Schizophyllum commune Loenen D]|nr:hypothetical protein K525DRAFT_204344 [Schizophyllum commune Loenen D]